MIVENLRGRFLELGDWISSCRSTLFYTPSRYREKVHRNGVVLCVPLSLYADVDVLPCRGFSLCHGVDNKSTEESGTRWS